MNPQDVTAVVITRGDQPAMIERLKRQYERVGFGETIIYEATSIIERYTAAEFAKNDVIFFQDDDVYLEDQDIFNILENYEPGILVSNMYDTWIEAQGYYDLALVGLGAVCDRGLWRDAFERFEHVYGQGEHLKWDADFIFGVLAPWRRFDFTGERVIDMEIATDASRLSLQPGQHERKFESIDMARQLRTVVLTMMSKNEEANIGRALESNIEWWDKLLLCDDSSDSTRDIARRICQKHGKEWLILDQEEGGFAEVRAQMIREGRKLADYMLLMDADEEWISETQPCERPLLWAEAYMLHYDGSVDYAQPRLIASRFPWKWEGKKHAHLSWDWEGEVLAVNLQWPRIRHHGDERSAANHGEADAEILKAEIAAGNDLHRNLFLLGKCYDGLHLKDDALRCYRERIELGSLDEEDYWCRLREGVLTCEHLNDFKTGIDLLWKAFQTRPHRAEALRAISFYVTAVADALPYPENDITLVLRNSYKSV